MKKKNIPYIVIIGSLILMVLNFIFRSDEMDFGFWTGIISNGLIIFSMLFIVREIKKTNGK